MWHTMIMKARKPGESVEEACKRIAAQPGIVAVEPRDELLLAYYVMNPQPNDEQGRWLAGKRNEGVFPTSCRICWLDGWMLSHLRTGEFAETFAAAKATGCTGYGSGGIIGFLHDLKEMEAAAEAERQPKGPLQ